MPPSTLVTNSSDTRPRLTAVMSHGPSMPWPANVSRTTPWLSSTIRQPGPEIEPFLVGSEPTTTQPPGSATRAVVRPTPPGHARPRWPTVANTDCLAAWADLDDRRAGALRVGLVVEVADEDVAGVQAARAARDDRHAVGVDVAGLRGRWPAPSRRWTVSVCNGPMKVGAALAAPAGIPLPTSSPAVAVITTATAAADRRIGFMDVCSLSPVKKMSPLLTTAGRASRSTGDVMNR